MRILVTGGAGFIGSNLVHLLVRRGHEVLNIDKLTYAGNLSSLAGLAGHPRHRFLQADICDAAAMRAAFTDFQPDAVMHLAAESHVDRSIDGPGDFIDTNILGTYTLLEAARAYLATKGQGTGVRNQSSGGGSQESGVGSQGTKASASPSSSDQRQPTTDNSSSSSSSYLPTLRPSDLPTSSSSTDNSPSSDLPTLGPSDLSTSSSSTDNSPSSDLPTLRPSDLPTSSPSPVSGLSPQPSLPPPFRFLHVSTDEVFGSLGKTGFFTESTAYDPHSPYSASKAASDHLARAWHDTYGLPVLVTNCSNNYGPFQFPEKLIPVVILKALRGEPIPVYGKGENIRDWLYVGDHAEALLTVLESGRVGETYNIGGNNEMRNIDLVRLLCSILDDMVESGKLNAASRSGNSFAEQIAFVTDRPGHDLRYAIDAGKIKSDLGWTPTQTAASGFRQTVEWYLANEPWWQNILNGAYRLERLGNPA